MLNVYLLQFDQQYKSNALMYLDRCNYFFPRSNEKFARLRSQNQYCFFYIGNYPAKFPCVRAVICKLQRLSRR